MAGSHEVRGSIPLGSTTDPRGAPRRPRAPLFFLTRTENKARGARSLLGVAAGWLALARLPWSLLVSFGGVGAGRRPFLVRPDSSAPFKRPCDDAAIEPASRAPKKGLAYRRASAGLRRLRREPDPCVRRRGGAGTHSARGCMGPAEFGNAGMSP